jgi:hypothetical protein
MAEVKTKIMERSMESYFQMGVSWRRAVLFCSADCAKEKCVGEGPSGAVMAMKHAGLHEKDFILLSVVFVFQNLA